MATLSTAGQRKRPQKVAGVFTAVPAQGRTIARAWPRARPVRSPVAQLERQAYLNAAIQLSKYASPCQQKYWKLAAQALHMLPRDLILRSMTRGEFIPFDGTGAHYWPSWAHDRVADAINAVGNTTQAVLTRFPTRWGSNIQGQPGDHLRYDQYTGDPQWKYI